MILIVIAIILLSLLLAGCSSSSPSIPNIFLISLYYQQYPYVLSLSTSFLSNYLRQQSSHSANFNPQCGSHALYPNFTVRKLTKNLRPVPSTAQANFGVHTAISNIVGRAQMEARVGYFGICVNPDGGAWLCSNNATVLANQVSMDQDPLNLIWLAEQFKDMIVFPYLM